MLPVNFTFRYGDRLPALPRNNYYAAEFLPGRIVDMTLPVTYS
jgi:hypothetical protein